MAGMTREVVEKSKVVMEKVVGIVKDAVGKLGEKRE